MNSKQYMLKLDVILVSTDDECVSSCQDPLPACIWETL